MSQRRFDAIMTLLVRHVPAECYICRVLCLESPGYTWSDVILLIWPWICFRKHINILRFSVNTEVQTLLIEDKHSFSLHIQYHRHKDISSYGIVRQPGIFRSQQHRGMILLKYSTFKRNLFEMITDKISRIRNTHFFYIWHCEYIAMVDIV